MNGHLDAFLSRIIRYVILRTVDTLTLFINNLKTSTARNHQLFSFLLFFIRSIFTDVLVFTIAFRKFRNIIDNITCLGIFITVWNIAVIFGWNNNYVAIWACCLNGAVATRTIIFDDFPESILWPTASWPDTLPSIIWWDLDGVTVMTSPWLVNYLVGFTWVFSALLMIVLCPCEIRAFLASRSAIWLCNNLLIWKAWDYIFTFVLTFRNFLARATLFAGLSCRVDLLIWVACYYIACFCDLIGYSNGWARSTSTVVQHNLVGSTRHFIIITILNWK